MTDRITKERQKEFMARTLVGMVLYNKREFTDEECAVYNSILALLDQSAPMLMGLRGIAPDATGDLSSEEFVRRVREGWTPPWKKPAPTDEERGEMVALLSDLEEDPSYHWFEQWGNKMGKLAGKIRALLQSPPKVSVTRAQVEQFVPCICIDAYKDRGLAQPDCPRCSLVDMDGLLAYLNYGIAFGEAREAVDSEEGKEEE